MNTENFTDRDWEELASALSEENGGQSELLKKLLSEDNNNIEKQWKEMGKLSDEKEINVDNAWNNLNSRLIETGSFKRKDLKRVVLMRNTLMRIAAVGLILLCIGSAVIYFGKTDLFSKNIIIATNNDQKNFKVILPDGSNIFLNRNTELNYHSNFGKRGRKVALEGEAFFEITADATKPFIIDAGKASVKVIGTSFNVITQNINSAVEVFVKTGKVMLSDNSGTQSLVLEPGYVGKVDSKLSEKTLNNDPNYTAWNTELLVYDGQKLGVVFKDLKKVYNMDIVADDPEILNVPWTSPIYNQPQDTIIRLICTSFNLSYSKDGNVYHLNKK